MMVARTDFNITYKGRLIFRFCPEMVKLHHRTDIQKPPCSPPASQFLKYATAATNQGCLGWQSNDNNNDEAGQDGTDDMINLKYFFWKLK